MEEVAGSRVTGGQRLFNVNVTPVNCQLRMIYQTMKIYMKQDWKPSSCEEKYF